MFLQRLRDALGGTSRFAEFMPDAEGVVERGHSPMAGLLIVLVTVVFAGLLGWAGLTEIEQVVHAVGQVEPAGRVKIINHPDGGRIVDVHVTEGQEIAAGTPLVTFDSELIGAELAELTGRLQVKQTEAARLGAESAGDEVILVPDLAAARPDLMRQQNELLRSRRAAHASRFEELAQAVERRAREVESLVADVARLRNSHSLLDQQVGAVRELADKGLYPRLRLVAAERQLGDVAGDISKSRSRIEAAQAALAEAKSRRSGFERQWRSAILSDLATAQAERDRLGEAVKRLQATLRNLVVRAPVDGIVQDLVVTTPGRSIGSNQPLMKVVPTGGSLVIEAQLANRDIGYVQVGQSATVKVRAYDFLRFGSLSGQVERIAADSTTDRDDGTLSYGITLRTESAELGSGAERYRVVPGMAVDVDLRVGERTILSFLTDRIFHVSEAAFREG